MTLTMEKLIEMGENASVQIAAGPSYLNTGKVLEPRLWDDLRQEMQRRLRRATGEPHAIVTFSFGQEAA
jgi:hypothetical protein